VFFFDLKGILIYFSRKKVGGALRTTNYLFMSCIKSLQIV